MRGFFSRRLPDFGRVLLVESGSRELFDNLVSGIYETHGEHIVMDLVTCYDGHPEGFRTDTGTIFRVTGYAGRAGRKRLYRELGARGYTVVGIICSGEPIMTKWKWVLAARIPAKVFILNENGDYFWLDYSHWHVMRHFVLFRAGLSGSGAVRSIGRLLLFPLTLAYLLLYAAVAHLRRKVHV